MVRLCWVSVRHSLSSVPDTVSALVDPGSGQVGALV